MRACLEEGIEASRRRGIGQSGASFGAHCVLCCAVIAGLFVMQITMCGLYAPNAVDREALHECCAILSISLDRQSGKGQNQVIHP